MKNGRSKYDFLGSELFFWLVIIFAIFSLVFLFRYQVFIRYKDTEKGYVLILSFGDNFGGVLNPAFTFITIILLLLSLRLQRVELDLTRRELERSASALEEHSAQIREERLERTFFSMLNYLNDIVNNMDVITGGQRERQGRDCFATWYRWCKSYIRAVTDKDGHNVQNVGLGFQNFTNKYSSDFGHYFRFLYNVIKFCDENIIESERYIKILRVQLLDQDFLLLFYNALTKQGEKFVPYVEKYQLFDNLRVDSLISSSDVQFYALSAYGENPKATGLTARAGS